MQEWHSRAGDRERVSIVCRFVCPGKVKGVVVGSWVDWEGGIGVKFCSTDASVDTFQPERHASQVGCIL